MARAGLGQEWTCIFANDISPKKAASYCANWGGDHFLVEDVFKVATKQIPSHAELAWGSFPCQDLSLAGAGTGLGGEKSSAFWGFWSLIQKLQKENRKPKIIVLENVYGTLTSHEGKDFEQIAKAVASAGYVFGAVVIDAVHFLPQSRPRLFVIGIDQSLHIPDNLHCSQSTPAWHPDAVIKAYNRLPKAAKNSWRWWNLPYPDKAVQTLDDIIEKDPTDVKWHTKVETARLLEMMSPLNRRKVIEAQNSGSLKVGTIYKRTRNGEQRAEVRFDGIAGCLRTPTGGSSRQTIMVVNGSQIRSRLISAREAARLMGLPDEYKLPEKYNDSYHLLGDGVVVPVVSHLNKFLLKPLLNANSKRTSKATTVLKKLKV